MTEVSASTHISSLLSLHEPLTSSNVGECFQLGKLPKQTIKEGATWPTHCALDCRLPSPTMLCGVVMCVPCKEGVLWSNKLKEILVQEKVILQAMECKQHFPMTTDPPPQNIHGGPCSVEHGHDRGWDGWCRSDSGNAQCRKGQGDWRSLQAKSGDARGCCWPGTAQGWSERKEMAEIQDVQKKDTKVVFDQLAVDGEVRHCEEFHLCFSKVVLKILGELWCLIEMSKSGVLSLPASFANSNISLTSHLISLASIALYTNRVLQLSHIDPFWSTSSDFPI